eukprot:g3214.t1
MQGRDANGQGVTLEILRLLFMSQEESKYWDKEKRCVTLAFEEAKKKNRDKLEKKTLELRSQYKVIEQDGSLPPRGSSPCSSSSSSSCSSSSSSCSCSSSSSSLRAL